MKYNFKLVNTFFISLCLTLLLYGCVFAGSSIDWKGDAYFENYAKWRNNRLNELSEYIGKTKEEIRAIFGEPNDIRYQIKYKGNFYEEEWLYKYEYGSPIINPNQHNDLLYFNDNRLVFVEVH